MTTSNRTKKFVSLWCSIGAQNLDKIYNKPIRYEKVRNQSPFYDKGN
jgi:hypothetical protein